MSTFRKLLFAQKLKISSGGGIVTSYSNRGGTGDRRSGTVFPGISVSAAGGAPSLQHSGGSPNDSRWVDGDNASFGQGFFPGTAVTSAKWILFDFTAGNPAIIDEAKYYQQDGTTQGVWKWQGSNDGSTFTDIGTSFTLGGAAIQTITALAGNTTAYYYYRLIGVSGSDNANPWVMEFEFKIYGF